MLWRPMLLLFMSLVQLPTYYYHLVVKRIPQMFDIALCCLEREDGPSSVFIFVALSSSCHIFVTVPFCAYCYLRNDCLKLPIGQWQLTFRMLMM